MSDLKLSERIRVVAAVGDGIRLDRAAAFKMIRVIESCESADERLLMGLANMRAVIDRNQRLHERMVRDIMMMAFCVCCIAVVL